ncbi:MAG: type II toxin-antitoxin system Phd/YefM family antitoxin [Geminicoccaceae bacterium]|nr:type II toxin-antitoxin system Phd/YefM family antitoxin [Geminicoccaceae bacterium]
MRTITAIDAKDRFEQPLDDAQREPVTVTRRGCPAAVVLSVEDFERMRGVAWERLARTIQDLRTEAAANGLTEEKLEELLAAES